QDAIQVIDGRVHDPQVLVAVEEVRVAPAQPVETKSCAAEENDGQKRGPSSVAGEVDCCDPNVPTDLGANHQAVTASKNRAHKKAPPPLVGAVASATRLLRVGRRPGTKALARRADQAEASARAEGAR